MPEIFIHLFLPHHTNNHRARVLHLDALLCYVFAFAVFYIGIGWIHRSYPEVLGYATDIRMDQLFTDTNAKRTEAGLDVLRLNNDLSRAAAKKAEDMFTNNYWAHFSPSGKTPWDFVTGSGYRYAIAGENLAKNFSNSEDVVDAWMASPTHRDNVMKPNYRDVGFAVVNGLLNGEETTLVVQMFGTTAQDLAMAPKGESKQINPSPAVAAQPITKATSVVVSEVASAIQNAPASSTLEGVVSSVTRPLIDITTVTRIVTVLFIGFLLGILVMDAWLMSRRKVIRAAGHTIGHVIFMGSLLLFMSIMARGSVL